jgi:hypothetical protein
MTLKDASIVIVGGSSPVRWLWLIHFVFQLRREKLGVKRRCSSSMERQGPAAPSLNWIVRFRRVIRRFSRDGLNRTMPMRGWFL